MASDTASARCYCGQVHLRLSGPAQAVTYCHCGDCKRWTGAPAPAFAAYAPEALHWTNAPAPRSFVAGVDRWCCPDCGSPMAARFDYLPGQVYVPLGVIDQIEALPPQLHCHAHARVAWLDDAAALPAHHQTGRDSLRRE